MTSLPLLAAYFLPPIAGAALAILKIVPLSLVVVVVGIISLLVARAAHAAAKPQPREIVIEREATLGADGLLLDEGFVPASELATIDASGDRCLVTARSGASYELTGTPLEMARAARLAATLRRSLASATSEARDDPSEVLLASMDATQLRKEGGGTYRGISFDRSRGLSIAEDPAALPRARIAAATLLAGDLDPDARVRIADVASSTAHPEVREALLAAAADGTVGAGGDPEDSRRSAELRPGSRGGERAD